MDWKWMEGRTVHHLCYCRCFVVFVALLLIDTYIVLI